MGIPVEEPEYGMNCVACYPPGRTPKHVHVTFSGMSIGAGWVPGLPSAPNHTFKLDQVGACRWTLQTLNWFVSYYAIIIGIPGVNSQLTLQFTTPVGPYAFGGQSVNGCITGFSNDITEPPNRFYKDGAGWVFY